MPLNGPESGGGHLPREVLLSFRDPAIRRINVAGKKKERTMNPLTQFKNTTILPVLIALTLVCFALSPQARAVCQEGCLTPQSTALGEDALRNTGVANTAIGFEALFSNTSGTYNTGVGAFALQFNTSGFENTAIGYGALPYNTSGQYNTASGRSALYANTTGSNNTANGYLALYYNTTGAFNTAIGRYALGRNTVGSNNIAIGAEAGANLNRGSNNIDIGNLGVPRESNVIRIGTVGNQTNTFIAGISGVTVAGGVAVVIDANGQLGTSTSSARFKDDIQPMDKASEAIHALKPVTFHYKQEIDPKGIPQFGLVAEDVEKVNPDLVARDEQGKPYTVRYEAVNAMLLNEFLKEHRKIEQQEKTLAQQDRKIQEQEATITQLKKEMKTVAARLEEQTAQIQNVSAQLELNQTASQIVLNNQ
jgi:hypothetical protein